MLKAMIALGNPGMEYALTRHNYGWLVADAVIEKCSLGKRQRGETYELFGGRYKGTEVLVCKPLTYMNRSGWAVEEFTSKQRLDVDDLIVLYDDIDIDFGLVKLRQGGGDGGHKGIRSIIDETGRRDFHRLRLGIKPESKPDDTAEYVLKPFSSKDEEILKELIPIAANAALDCLFTDPRLVMNKVNRTNLRPETE